MEKMYFDKGQHLPQELKEGVRSQLYILIYSETEIPYFIKLCVMNINYTVNTVLYYLKGIVSVL